jgi:hypothetical protein
MKIATILGQALQPKPRKLAQPSEPVTRAFRMVTCATHFSIHRERTTCVRPRD